MNLTKQQVSTKLQTAKNIDAIKLKKYKYLSDASKVRFYILSASEIYIM